MVNSSDEVVKFRSLFNRLREWIDDDPNILKNAVDHDDSIGELCVDLGRADAMIRHSERLYPELFASPVDPGFIALWRDYENRYAKPIYAVLASRALGFSISEHELVVGKEWATIEADWDAGAVDDVFTFAHDQLNACEISEALEERVRRGLRGWNSLTEEVGFDLRGILRRRKLVPFVMMPSHLAAKQSRNDPMIANLKDAQDAFVFGAHLASIAMLRSIVEVVTREYYGAKGEDLKQCINDARGLPNSASADKLHRLRITANKVMHNPTALGDAPSRQAEFEGKIVVFLGVVRALIEGAPAKLPRVP